MVNMFIIVTDDTVGPRHAPCNSLCCLLLTWYSPPIDPCSRLTLASPKECMQARLDRMLCRFNTQGSGEPRWAPIRTASGEIFMWNKHHKKTAANQKIKTVQLFPLGPFRPRAQALRTARKATHLGP